MKISAASVRLYDMTFLVVGTGGGIDNVKAAMDRLMPPLEPDEVNLGFIRVTDDMAYIVETHDADAIDLKSVKNGYNMLVSTDWMLNWINEEFERKNACNEGS